MSKRAKKPGAKQKQKTRDSQNVSNLNVYNPNDAMEFVLKAQRKADKNKRPTGKELETSLEIAKLKTESDREERLLRAEDSAHRREAEKVKQLLEIVRAGETNINNRIANKQRELEKEEDKAFRIRLEVAKMGGATKKELDKLNLKLKQAHRNEPFLSFFRPGKAEEWTQVCENLGNEIKGANRRLNHDKKQKRILNQRLGECISRIEKLKHELDQLFKQRDLYDSAEAHVIGLLGRKLQESLIEGAPLQLTTPTPTIRKSLPENRSPLTGLTGTVTYYNKAKRHGKISVQNGDTFFFSTNKEIKSFGNPEGLQVKFDGIRDQGGHLYAKNVRPR